MAKLNQLIAASQTRKAQLQEAWTRVHRNIGKEDILTGLTRVYTPRNEDGEPKPTERKNVQMTADTMISELETSLVELFDLVATIDFANTEAKADVVVEGTVLLGNVPATHLLFLEKQLVDLRSFVLKLPILDPAERWTQDPASGDGVWVSQPTESVSTAKVIRSHVSYPATDKHPAQVTNYNEDVPVGKWTTTKRSGALQRSEVQAMLRRVETLQGAVKFARESANAITVTTVSEGKAILDYIFLE